MDKTSIIIVKHHDFEAMASIVEEVQNLHARLYPAVFKPYVLAEMK